jgi:hypothetical protein
MYPTFMNKEPHMRKIEGHIPRELWERYEKWAEGRGKIQMRQLLTALFRLFLSSPEWMQLRALYATEDSLNIAAGIRQSQLEFSLAQEEKQIDREQADPLGAVRAIVDQTKAGTMRILSPEEQKIIDEVRRALGPSEEEQQKRHRKEKRA